MRYCLLLLFSLCLPLSLVASDDDDGPNPQNIPAPVVQRGMMPHNDVLRDLEEKFEPYLREGPHAQEDFYDVIVPYMATFDGGRVMDVLDRLDHAGLFHKIDLEWETGTICAVLGLSIQWADADNNRAIPYGALDLLAHLPVDQVHPHTVVPNLMAYLYGIAPQNPV